MLSNDSLTIPEGIQQGTLRIEPHAVTPAIAALRPGDRVDYGDERLRIVSGERGEDGNCTFKVVRAKDVWIVELGDETSHLPGLAWIPRRPWVLSSSRAFVHGGAMRPRRPSAASRPCSGAGPRASTCACARAFPLPRRTG